MLQRRSAHRLEASRLEVGEVDDAGLELQFVVSDSLMRYPVRFNGAPPDMFQENGGVVIEGSFQEDVFVGDNLLVKHSNEYRPPEDGSPVNVEELKESLR